MNLFNKPALAIILLSCISCAAPKKSEPVEELLSASSLNTESNILFLILYPDDCLNCFGNANRHLNYLAAAENFPSSNLFIVIPDVRHKSKTHFFRHILPFDSTRHDILESTELITAIKKNLTEEEGQSSFIAVYSKDKQFIKACKLKQISSEEDLINLIR
jgi:hypothetical protein